LCEDVQRPKRDVAAFDRGDDLIFIDRFGL